MSMSFYCNAAEQPKTLLDLIILIKSCICYNIFCNSFSLEKLIVCDLLTSVTERSATRYLLDTVCL